MAVRIAPPIRQQFVDANGNPRAGAKLFTYAAGSSTKQPTFTDSTGLSANANPIPLDAEGRTPFGLWLTAGLNYKFVFAPSTDTDPPSSPIFTEDNVSGVNDSTTTTSQWVASGATPTYISATQFTLVGDKTAVFHVGRRVRFTVTAGTVYGLITASAFTTLTTVTVSMDTPGVLDSGLSVVDLSILTVTGPSLPKLSSAALTIVGIQAVDATLTALAALDATTGIVEQTGVDTFTKRAIGTASGNVAVIGTTSATETLAGLMEIATTAEAVALASNTVAMTPAKTSSAVFTVMNASGSAPMFACRAWVNFNGTGTLAVRAAGNATITDAGIGTYTVNFTTAMPDTNFAFTVGYRGTADNNTDLVPALAAGSSITTTAATFVVNDMSLGSLTDIDYVCLAFFR